MDLPARRRGRIIPLAAFVAAAACVFFMKSGFLIIFFLVPLGFVRFRYNPETAWAAFGAAFAVNLLLALISVPALEIPVFLVILDQFFFIALAGVFTWISGPVFLAVPGVWRMIAGSAAAALVFLLIFFQRQGSEILYEAIKTQIEAFKSLYGASLQGAPDTSAANSAAQNAVLDSLTPELFLEATRAVMLRGGALVSAVSIFWFSRLASLGLTRLSRGTYTPRRLKNFYADSRLIWFFSSSLVLILVLRALRFAPLEILLWNILTLCAILYLAQGIGIVQHFVTRPAAPPFLRLLLPVAVIVMIFSPGINVVLPGLLVLLGIVENWVPLRAAKADSGGTP